MADPENSDSSKRKINELEHSPANDSVSATGRTMTMIASIIGIFLATWLFSGVEERQHNPNSSPDSISSINSNTVHLQRNKMGHYVTSGYLNGEKVVYLLDTGATDVAIPGALERKLNLSRGYRHSVGTANGTTDAYTTKVDSIQIGDIRLNQVNAVIVPNMEGEEILLGMAALKQLEFRQKGRRLTLIQEL